MLWQVKLPVPVSLDSASGATFDSGSIVLRGTTSFNNATGSEPIYVVDGSITNKSAFNMDDVESINVLKGPAATALYGYQGANGAVIITTKKAKEGRGVIEVSHTIEWESYYNHVKLQHEYGGGYAGGDGEILDAKYGTAHPDIDFMSAAYLYGNDYQYGGYPQNADGSYVIDYADDASWGARFDPNIKVASALYWDPTSSKYHQADPWVAQMKFSDLYHTGVGNTTNVAFSKAGRDYNVRVSFTNSDRTGIIYNSSAVRRYLGFKTFFKPADWLNVNLDYKYTYRRDHNGAAEGYGEKGAVIGDYIQWGQMNVNLKELKDYMRPDGTWRTWNITSPTNFEVPFHDNPYAQTQELNSFNTYQWNVFTGDVEALLPYKIKAGFRAIGNFRNWDGYSQSPQMKGNHQVTNGSYSQGADYVRDLTLQGRITWGDRFVNDRLSVDAAAFIENRHYNYGTLNANTTEGLLIPGWYNLNSTKSYVGATNSKSKYITRSIFGTATVGFDDTYFLDGSIRTDWSSTLPTKNNHYTYGGLSGSIIMNNLMKTFMKVPSWLTFWKLRASMAQVGSTLGAYAVNPIYNQTTKYNTQLALIQQTTQLNQNIKPTISTSYEIGTEFRLFDSRVWGDINLYKRNTKNQIVNATVSPASGYASRQLNAGLVQNKGIEISLGFTPLKNKDFQWDLEGNISKNKNKLIRLTEGVDDVWLYWAKFSYRWFEKSIVGRPVGDIQTEARLKRDDNGNLILSKTTAKNAAQWGGDYRLQAEAGQLKTYGNFQPKWTGGFSTSIRYKDFRFNATFDYMIGGSFVSWTNLWGEGSGLLASTSYNNANGVNIREGVTKGGGIPVHGVLADGTPVDCYMNPYQYFSYRSTYDMDGCIYSRTYVKLREVSLLYNIPASLLAKARIGISQASISFIATNPWLIHSACPNVDPSETSSNIIEGGQAPSTRSYGVTVKLTF
jgi:TonB-linked SusC/RagA family outer membrane protein